MVCQLCPRCSCNLLTQPFRDWLVYMCPECEGVLVERSVVQELVHQPDLHMSPLRPAAQEMVSNPHPPEVLAQPVICPICQSIMEIQPAPDYPEYEVRQCPQDQQIWFDDGELGSLADLVQLRQPNLPHSPWEGLRRLLGAKPRIKYIESPK